MISLDLRRNVVARVRDHAQSLTSPEVIVAACEWTDWQEFLNEWAGAVSAKDRSGFLECFSDEARVLLRELHGVLSKVTERRGRESAQQFAASKRFLEVAPIASKLVEALDVVEHPRPLT